MADAAELKSLVLRLAGELGFVRAGVAAAAVSDRADRFGRFIDEGLHAGMTYLARDVSARCDPTRLLEGAASVICLAASYAPADDPPSAIARYARGRDYHRLLRKRCRKLADALAQAAGGARTKVCVDTSPLLERDLAAAAGLGWIGRNGCLIDAECGSYLLLAEIVTDLPLAPDEPVANGCGPCRACIDACPTGAIRAGGLVDSRRCASYLTIEHRGEIPPEFAGGCGRWVLGCDACQEVCPYNRQKGLPSGDAELRGPSQLARTPAAAMLDWTADDWDQLTRGSAARRAKLAMFLRNAAIAAGAAGDRSALPALERLAGHESAAVAAAARWAIGELTKGDEAI